MSPAPRFVGSEVKRLEDPRLLRGHAQYVDDLILVPLGIALALRLIPPAVMDDCRGRAREALVAGKPTSRVAGAVVVAIWLLGAALVGLLLARWLLGD